MTNFLFRTHRHSSLEGNFGRLEVFDKDDGRRNIMIDFREPMTAKEAAQILRKLADALVEKYPG